MTGEATPIRVAWRTRHTPLAPRAVVVAHAARATLLRSLALGLQEPTQLSFAESGDYLLVTGPQARLPWADGAVYLGAEARTPQLLVPTWLSSSVPPALLERALRRQTGVLGGTLAVLAEHGHVIDASSVRPLTSEALTALLASERQLDD